MSDLPDQGLYRTTKPFPMDPQGIPSEALVYVGRPEGTDSRFVVRPQQNELNRWFWSDPTLPLTDATWARSLIRMPSEGFYTLPEDLNLEGGGRWLKNAIVQLGYDRNANPLLFVGQRHAAREDNVLVFSDRGIKIKDDLMRRLTWAPILPVAASKDTLVH